MRLMSTRIRHAAAITLLLAGQFAGAAPAADRWTLIEAGAVADIQKKSFLPRAQILIKNDRIQAIGRNLRAPPEAQRIDLSNAYVLPGFIDMHVHVFSTYDQKSRLQTVLTQSSADNALYGLKNLQTLLHSGFTTVRMPGDKDQGFASISIRNAINRGDFEGPRMFVAPHFLGPLGGHGDLNDVSPDWEGHVEGQVIHAGVDNMREAVRRELKYGADLIKIMVTGGVMSQNDDPSVQGFSDEELVALAEEAHRHHKKITAHAHGDAGAYAAVKAGFDSIEHGTMISDETIKLMVKKGTFLVPTVYVLDWIVAQGPRGGISANNHEKALRVSKTRDAAVLAAYKAGVRLALGSDSIFPHEQAVREFAAMARLGIANWDVLRAGTLGAAELLGQESNFGTLEAGKLADVVAIPGDPIADVTQVEKAFFVMKEGRVVRHDRP